MKVIEFPIRYIHGSNENTSKFGNIAAVFLVMAASQLISNMLRDKSRVSPFILIFNYYAIKKAAK
jgi:hypothetical protein